MSEHFLVHDSGDPIELGWQLLGLHVQQQIIHSFLDAVVAIGADKWDFEVDLLPSAILHHFDFASYSHIELHYLSPAGMFRLVVTDVLLAL